MPLILDGKYSYNLLLKCENGSYPSRKNQTHSRNSSVSYSVSSFRFLYDAIAEAKAVPDEAKDPVFLTNARLLAFVNKIEAHLGLAASTSL